MTTTDYTRLSMVNEVLTSVGFGPVTSESQTRASTQAGAVLDSESSTIQAEGWDFNLEFKQELTASGGELTLPVDVLWAVPYDCSNNWVMRLNVMYDLDTNSSTGFTGTHKLNYCRNIDPEKLPRPARDYVVARAARVYQDRFLGSPELGTRLLRDELSARERLIGFEGQTRSYSAFDNIQTAQIRFGRGYPIFTELH